MKKAILLIYKSKKAIAMVFVLLKVILLNNCVTYVDNNRRFKTL